MANGDDAALRRRDDDLVATARPSSSSSGATSGCSSSCAAEQLAVKSYSGDLDAQRSSLCDFCRGHWYNRAEQLVVLSNSRLPTNVCLIIDQFLRPVFCLPPWCYAIGDHAPLDLLRRAVRLAKVFVSEAYIYQ